jgi:cysteine desulfurase
MEKRSEKPILYLDYAASTPVRPAALDVLATSMKEDYANPSSAHKLGKGLHKRIEECREQLLGYMGGRSGDRLFFTSSATESNNTVIKGVPLKPGETVLVSFADHPSVTAPVAELRKRGIEVGEIPLKPDGTLDEELFFTRVEPTVKLIILTYVNNQSGVIIDVNRISNELKKINPGVHIHVDAAQGFGKLPFGLKDSQIDSLCISSHKLGGPKGTAALVLRRGVLLDALMVGGGQEDGLRASTQAAPLIFSLTEAVREAVANIDNDVAHVTDMYRLALERIKKKIPSSEFPFNSEVSPYILTFLLPGIPSDIILRHLEQQGIMISSTSACSSKIKGVNTVFTALHIPPKQHKFVLRASFSAQTTADDVERFADALAIVYDELYMIRKHRAR